MFFSFFLIFNALVNRWLINPSSEEDHKKALNGLLLINSEEHLILGLVNISCLAYAHANHRTSALTQLQYVITTNSAT